MENFLRKYKTSLSSSMNRPVYLWGAAQTGIGMLKALERISIKPAGFIDKRKADLQDGVCGFPVFLLHEVIAAHENIKPFIINTTTMHMDRIFRECEAVGLLPEKDLVSYEQLCPVDYQVIVSSTCNLRCISCPVGNRPRGMHKGFMHADDYVKVLDKILYETPLITIMQLFNWGEPFLNPELAKIIEITNERGVLCSLSSNMNIVRNFEDVIAARPAFLRISMSGNRNSYGITHTDGKWDLLVNNLRTLHDLRTRYNPDMLIEVAYHVYATTTAEDIRNVHTFCDDLGFIFRPHLAALLPLDNVRDYMDKKVLSKEACATIDMLRIPIDEAIRLASEHKGNICCFDHSLTIESDLSVKQCGLWTYPEGNIVADNFLEISIEDIMSKRLSSSLCNLCKESGLHRFCSIYTDNSSDLK
jgi:MoaA/NifB/PqqE/SkfB family radical SAM enzyme